MRTHIALGTLALLGIIAAHDTAHADEVTATPSGEYLMRFRHFEGKDFAHGGVTNFVRHRARLGLRLDYDEEIAAFIQFQDVRIWGEESDTLRDFSGDGIDAHQAYMDLSFDEDVRLRVGRQEIGYLNHRLIGNVGFQEQGRSFDAVRLMIMTLDRELALDFFYARTAHALLPPNENATDDVLAFAAKMQVSSDFQPALISVLDLGSGVHRVRSTTGLVLTYDADYGLKVTAEGYVQAGSADPELSIFAWMAALRARYTFVDSDMQPFFELFGQFLSGDADPTDSEVHTFDTLFATNHKFYGEADLFANMAADTANRGLIDAGFDLGFDLEGILGFTLAMHVFSTMENRDGPSLFAIEFDNTLSVRATDHFSFDLNYTLTAPGEALNGSEDRLIEHFFYFTTAASF